MVRCGGWFLLGSNGVKNSLRSNPCQTNSGPRKRMASVFWRDFERRNGNAQFKNNQSDSFIGWVSIQNIHFRTFFPKILEKQFGKFRNILCMNFIQKNNVKLQRRATIGALRLRRSHATAGPIITLVTYVLLYWDLVVKRTGTSQKEGPL